MSELIQQGDYLEWDFKKDILNQEKHGIPLRFALVLFQDPNHFTWQGKYDKLTGEQRYCAYGKISNRLFCCVHVRRGIKIRIISLMRKSGKYENAYQKNLDKSRD